MRTPASVALNTVFIAALVSAAPLGFGAGRCQAPTSRPAAEDPPALLVPNDGTTRPPRLQVYQAMWGMENLPRGGKPWTLEERFAKVAEGGWDGIDMVASPNKAEHPKILALADKHKLRLGLLCFLNKAEDLDVQVEAFTALHADYLNSQILTFPVATQKGIDTVRAMFAKTRKLGIPFFTETHRSRLTQDLLQTSEIAGALPELAFCADFSHYVVAYEFGWGIPKEFQPALDKISSQACMIDGRVSNGEQIQIDIGPDGKNPHAVKFAGYWKKIMTAWLKRARAGDIFVFRTELGPPDYGIVDAQGVEVSDRFEQAKVMKALAIRTWNEAVKGAQIGEEHAP